MKRFFIILSAVFSLFSISLSNSHATTYATFNASTGAVSIPSLQIPGDATRTTYSVGMQQTQGLNFAVTSAASTGSGSATAYTATYNASTGTVDIPYITIAGDNSGTSYYVNLKQGQGLNFAVTSITANSSSTGTPLVGTWSLDAANTVWTGGTPSTGWSGVMIINSNGTYSTNLYNPQGVLDDSTRGTWSLSSNNIGTFVVTSVASGYQVVGSTHTATTTFSNNNNTYTFTYPGGKDVWNRVN